MKSYLLYKQQEYPWHKSLTSLEEYLADDLELDIILQTMSAGDKELYKRCQDILLHPCRDKEELTYRQAILQDFIQHPGELRHFYETVCRTLKVRQNHLLMTSRENPRLNLSDATDILSQMQGPMKNVTAEAQKLLSICQSEGLQILCQGITSTFHESFLKQMDEYVKSIKPNDTITTITLPHSVKASRSNRLTHNSASHKKGLFGISLLAGKKDKSISFDFDPQNEEVIVAVKKLRNDMLKGTSRLFCQVRDEIKGFFTQLKGELGFYVACLNLYEQLEGMPRCFPKIGESTSFASDTLTSWSTHNAMQGITGDNVYSVSLHLLFKQDDKKSSTQKSLEEHCESVVCCDIHIKNEQKLTMITGANQGGKTTFLRSVGQAYLMMNAGMFVGADYFSATPGHLYTHFIREEDEKLKSGKLDEELKRMSEIVSQIQPGDLLLMNESFSSTSEQEGSAIAYEILSPFMEHGIHTLFVTHFLKLIEILIRESPADQEVLYLNANRKEDGSRSFKITEGFPKVVGYGQDLFNEIFQNS